ncbi:rhodanese-related sulfurtransferase [Desulfitispora alkaliphila]|uniref:rhodanese-like domain-containing protein n=1 Tax=Desulfitispora alkaliphila TaxID=622674 RepID=UPI003D22AD87
MLKLPGLKICLIAFLLIASLALLPACQETSPNDPNRAEPQKENISTSLLTRADSFFKENPVDVITASEVFEKVVMRPDPNYYLIDLREQDDFLEASIQGAVNIPYNSTGQVDQLHKIPEGYQIVLICYDGSLSSKLSPLLSMLGYEVTVMNNGMLGWYNNPPEVCEMGDYPVVQEPTLAKTTYSLPQLELPTKSIEDTLMYLNEKLRKDLNDTTNNISSNKLAAADNQHFLLDLRAEEHYANGHIEGAINIPFESLGERENLTLLPPDREIILICYTGHLANQASTILNLLGYETVVLKDGMSDWTTQVEFIGVQPTKCQWVSCYADENFEAGFPVAKVECDWGDLPTVETFIDETDDEGG